MATDEWKVPRPNGVISSRELARNTSNLLTEALRVLDAREQDGELEDPAKGRASCVKAAHSVDPSARGR
jgi:hypothetical protein